MSGSISAFSFSSPTIMLILHASASWGGRTGHSHELRDQLYPTIRGCDVRCRQRTVDYQWYETELGRPWEGREIWEAASPFNKVDKITTPTMFIGGEKDWNVPINNSEQMYQGMKSMGRETLLVVYPDADHGVRRPIYQKDLLERFLGWFDKYVKRSQPANQKE